MGIGLSNEPVGPRNTLEIDARDLAGVETPNNSGLQFRQLNSSSITGTANGLVLTVDPTGKVILVPDGATPGVAGFGACPGGNTLSTDGAVNLNGNNAYFLDNTSTGGASNSVGIGLTSCATLTARLEVNRPDFGNYVFAPIGVRVLNSDLGTYSTGVVALTNGVNPYNYGGSFTGMNAESENIGVAGQAYQEATENKGVSGYATDYLGDGSGYNYYGVYGRVDGNNTGDVAARYNYGVYGTASPTAANPFGGSTRDIGVYGYAPPPNGPLGCCGGYNTNWAGYFSGEVYATGTFTSSDSIFKQNVDTIPNALNIILSLRPHKYTFNTNDYPYMSFSSKMQYGLIAQEVQQIIPDIVEGAIQPPRYDTSGIQISPELKFKSLNYTEIIPILIQAIKTQQTQIDNLTTIINNCCNAQQAPPQNKDGGNNNGNGGSGNDKKLENGNIHAIELSNATGSAIIYQNQPNPFNSGGTKIRYFVPDNTNNPQIVFFDEFGGKLSTFNILETGMGELDVTASNLSSGVYSYSLIINGKVIDTKKMIFQK